VIIAGLGHGKIDNEFDTVDVQASGGHVGGYQYLDLAIAKAIHYLFAIALGNLAMNKVDPRLIVFEDIA